MAVAVAVSVAGQLGGGQHGGRPVGGVGEERAAEALPTALASVTVDGRLELVGVAQRSLVTLVGVEVLHVSAGQGRNEGRLGIWSEVQGTGTSYIWRKEVSGLKYRVEVLDIFGGKGGT